MNWTDIRQALESAAAQLRRVDAVWTEDASTVASAAVAIDPTRLRYLAYPERLLELRQAISISEGIVDDMVDA
jgi:hypothetical protein